MRHVTIELTKKRFACDPRQGIHTRDVVDLDDLIDTALNDGFDRIYVHSRSMKVYKELAAYRNAISEVIATDSCSKVGWGFLFTLHFWD